MVIQRSSECIYGVLNVIIGSIRISIPEAGFVNASGISFVINFVHSSGTSLKKIRTGAMLIFGIKATHCVLIESFLQVLYIVATYLLSPGT